jgi:hypothetical protein
MLALEFFKWWYGQGWLKLFNDIKKRIADTFKAFSAPILLRTLFAPWRRIISYPGSGLGNHIQALVDNLISRVVGLSVRLLTLFAVAITTTFIGIAGAIGLVLWPLLPVGCILLIIKALV